MLLCRVGRQINQYVLNGGGPSTVVDFLETVAKIERRLGWDGAQQNLFRMSQLAEGFANEQIVCTLSEELSDINQNFSLNPSLLAANKK